MGSIVLFGSKMNPTPFQKRLNIRIIVSFRSCVPGRGVVAPSDISSKSCYAPPRFLPLVPEWSCSSPFQPNRPERVQVNSSEFKWIEAIQRSPNELKSRSNREPFIDRITLWPVSGERWEQTF